MRAASFFLQSQAKKQQYLIIFKLHAVPAISAKT